MKKNQKGFGAIEAIIIILVIAILGFVGWYVWKQNHKSEDKKTSTSQSSNNSDTNKEESKEAEKADPYAGWQTGVAAYEKFNYKYPTDWKVDVKKDTSGTVNPGSDRIIFTAPKGLRVEVATGVDGVGSGVGMKSHESNPINTLGASYFLAFRYDGSDETMDNSKITGPCVAQDKSGVDILLSAKNIKTQSGAMALNSVCIQYAPTSSGDYVKKTVAEFKNDPNYADAVKIIESFTY